MEIHEIIEKIFSIKNIKYNNKLVKQFYFFGIKIKLKKNFKFSDKQIHKLLEKIIYMKKVPLVFDKNFWVLKHFPIKSEEVNYTSTKNTIGKTGIILQGPILKENNFTLETCKLYKKLFNSDDATIVLSTWKNSDQDIIEQLQNIGVEVVLSDLPKNMGYSNINCQIVSTNAGLKKCEELNCEYVIKTRTDQRFYSTDILEFLFNILKQFPLDTSVNQLNNRLIALSFNSFKYRYYGVSDMFLFGHINDVKKYWDITFNNNSKSDFSDLSDIEMFQKKCPETLIASKFLENIGLNLDYTMKQNLEIFAKYFCFIDKESIEMFWPKYSNFNSRWDLFETTLLEEIKFKDWLNLYNRNGIHPEWENKHFDNVPKC